MASRSSRRLDTNTIARSRGSRFVTPEVVRLPLSDGDWIDVKKELNSGEYDAMNAGVIKDLRAGEVPVLDFEKVASYKICAYVVGWSFTDSAGKSVPVSASSIANLNKSTRDEIAKAIEAHEDESTHVIKNDLGDDDESKPISKSVA